MFSAFNSVPEDRRRKTYAEKLCKPDFFTVL
ncbi:LOW QUALITY PROTEIN: hypothetical protein PanWU01x14_042400 [Parasponia andersonii]|uniref:Uncharacterized protein n=1 Tax=Parasponia andersonii TaxID=3476 RepID=A0A2P5DQP0_PARAD|nr:LOW QUALITY PROTEIN: hypothetical protein PanWU01x14_042400 [Parasponia andersonii]